MGEERAASLEPGLRPELKVQERHTYNLLTVLENELGTPGVKFFRSEVLLAEDVSFAPGIKSGKDYLLNALPFFKKQGFQSFSEIKPVDLGGITFYREDLTKRVTADVTAHQAYFCAILRGYALNFAVTTDEGDATERLADSVHFGSKAAQPTKAQTSGSGSGSLRGRLD